MRSKKRTELDGEVADVHEAAIYLKCSKRTLQDWINDRRFGSADGLRWVGGLMRIHMPTLRRDSLTAR
jgi:excisionase family DNA binding protein